jgi:hypothetical protein
MKLPEPIYFKDYKPCDYTIISCLLEFIIDNGSTRVDNVMEIKRQNPDVKELRLDGEMMDIELLWINDVLF